MYFPTGFPGQDDDLRGSPAAGPPRAGPGGHGFLGNPARWIGRLVPKRKPGAERTATAALSGSQESWNGPRALDESLRIRFLHDQLAELQPGRLRDEPETVVFWDALDPVERDAFRAAATARTFAAGARLISEGDEADYVIVILSGRTMICVQENGRKRVLAERGPGQLVGERAVLRVSVRSASVIALERVQALVARTGDFAAFISAHPRVLGIVEGQIYDRHIEDPVRYGPDVLAGWPGSRAAAGEGGRLAQATRPARYPQALNGENCTVILSDVVGFGARSRTDDDRRVVRDALFGMTHTALRDLPDTWSWEDRGDGLLTVVPPSVPTALVIKHLHKGLLTALEEHNRAHRSPARIRLRVAVNVGPVVTDTMGVSGEAIIVTARLVEAPLFKQAMEKGQADLGIIASAFIHETVIRHDAALGGYSEVRVEVKESSFPAWMKIFNGRGATVPAGSGRP